MLINYLLTFLGGKVMVDNLQWKDCQEGIKAFIEKKHPVWCHTDEQFEK